MEKKELTALTDSELLDSYRSTGENQYVQEIFARYRQKIQSACLKFFRRNRSLAEDAIQETYLKALHGAGQDTIRNFGGWLMRVAMNSCIDIHRKERASIMESHSGTDPVLIAVSAKRDTLQEDARVQELIQRINELAPRQRVCLKLYLEGYSYQEISRITRYSDKEIKSAIQTGKENLKKSFKE